MTTKEIAKNTINKLPPDSTIEDIMFALYVKMKFMKGEQEIIKSKGISHSDAKKRFQKWII